MSLAAELNRSNTGLVYRARPARPQRPLIVMLHGLSGDENVMWLFERALPPAATAISPRALFESTSGASWTRSVSNGQAGRSDFSEAVEALQRFIPEMIQRYEADARRVVMMGFSQGAALSYALSAAQPGLLCGVIALAGFMPFDASHSSTPLHSTQNVLPRYLIIHGVDDNIVPITLAREARAVLEARGAQVEYHEYPGGHKISTQGMKDIAQWITTTLREM